MRRDLILGLVFSLVLNGGIAWLGEMVGNGPDAPKAKPPAVAVELLEMPKVDPDPPEVVDDNEQQPPPVDVAPPSLDEVPQMVTDTSFVQQLQPPPPDNMSINKNALTIPPNTGNWKAGIGEIFDISKLDQIPRATNTVRPAYPFEMRRAGISGQVVVNFIVDSQGNVRNPFASSSTQREFEAAAVQALSKWRFTPGKRGGRAVNTQMQIPIVFSLTADE